MNTAYETIAKLRKDLSHLGSYGTRGVGYDVQVPLSTFYRLPDAGGEVSLRIHTHVREDALSLFGFASSLELQIFERLARKNPSVTEFHRFRALGHNSIGILQSAMGRPADALQVLRDLRTDGVLQVVSLQLKDIEGHLPPVLRLQALNGRLELLNTHARLFHCHSSVRACRRVIPRGTEKGRRVRRKCQAAAQGMKARCPMLLSPEALC